MKKNENKQNQNNIKKPKENKALTKIKKEIAKENDNIIKYQKELELLDKIEKFKNVISTLDKEKNKVRDIYGQYQAAKTIIDWNQTIKDWDKAKTDEQKEAVVNEVIKKAIEKQGKGSFNEKTFEEKEDVTQFKTQEKELRAEISKLEDQKKAWSEYQNKMQQEEIEREMENQIVQKGNRERDFRNNYNEVEVESQDNKRLKAINNKYESTTYDLDEKINTNRKNLGELYKKIDGAKVAHLKEENLELSSELLGTQQQNNAQTLQGILDKAKNQMQEIIYIKQKPEEENKKRNAATNQINKSQKQIDESNNRIKELQSKIIINRDGKESVRPGKFSMAMRNVSMGMRNAAEEFRKIFKTKKSPKATQDAMNFNNSSLQSQQNKTKSTKSKKSMCF